MTDLSRLDRDVREAVAALLDLQDLARNEDAGAPWRSSGEGVAVTGGGTSDPTFERVDDARKYATRDRIAEVIGQVANQLRREVTRQRPKQTGPCKTRGCKAGGVFGGYCDRCDLWRRNNPGMDPAEQVTHVRDDRGVTVETRSLIDDWNDRLPRWCDCGLSCCPDGCDDQAAHGRTVSERCKKRIQRARQDERAAS